MRFTRLRLNGFKSFVDATEVVIHEGLTGIVGPNGCGKSNLLEAMRWVMGENRPSAMRGGGMEDVIFAGAATRPARAFAEVALVIDNAERLAPSGFNDQDQIEIVRRITRDAGSAYRANSREVRARDVQMLFADASTGAHSPALVRQGQIAELISAKPKARRRILEEAAGISGLYARRHEAELRLTATEANLARVDDVLGALSEQIAALTRQARQAARYRELSEALRRAEGMLLYRRFREADIAVQEAERTMRDRLVALGQAEAAARAALAAREAAEEALPPLREEEAIAGAVLQRLLVSRDAIAGQEAQARAVIDALRGRLAQLDQDAEREAALNRDAAETIARLDWETEALAKAAEGEGDRIALAAETARAAGAVLAEAEARLAALTEDAARLAARHQSAARMLSDNRAALARAEAEAARAAEAARLAEGSVAAAGAALEVATEAREAAQMLVEDTEAALAEAEAARAETAGREAEARSARSSAEGEALALRSEVEALARLMQREGQAGHLVIDRLRVDPGYEAAIGAALADDLRAPEVEGEARSGWVTLPPYDAAEVLPEGAEPLAVRVEGPGVLARRLMQVGLVARDRGAALQAGLRAGQRLVSVEGDLWRWDGFRAAAEDAPQASAQRLRQVNRLVKLKRDLEEVSARAAGARQAHEALTARAEALAGAERMAREARRAADARLAEANRAHARAEAEGSIAGGRLEAARLALARFADEAEDARVRLEEAAIAADDLPALEDLRADLEGAKVTVEAARQAMIARRSAHDEQRREAEARARRRQEVARDLAGWRQRLETAARRAEDLAGRRSGTEAELDGALEAPEDIARRREEIEEAIAGAETRRVRAVEALAGAEAALRAAQGSEREAERAAGEAREGRARAEARVDAAREGRAAAGLRIREVADMTVDQLLSSLRADPEAMPDAEALEVEVARLKRQREALGAVNLRAEEDLATVGAEHDTLAREKTDLEEAVKRLRAGIAGLNREGRERLLTAFEQVNGSFATLFTTLFGGGEARLVLVESDDPLEAGLEIMCQPPGKKLSTLSLLSGGEQTLTAMALIFAVFLANPAPICVLDEVDAPLDDANVTRFCDLLDEMTRRTETRFLIITHHAVTMARMDRLYGVTMAEQGVSQLVSVDLRRAEAMVA
ncbi:MAG: chromosome segregation protein SMC [Gemmobacter sp.]